MAKLDTVSYGLTGAETNGPGELEWGGGNGKCRGSPGSGEGCTYLLMASRP